MVTGGRGVLCVSWFCALWTGHQCVTENYKEEIRGKNVLWDNCSVSFKIRMLQNINIEKQFFWQENYWWWCWWGDMGVGMRGRKHEKEGEANCTPCQTSNTGKEFSHFLGWRHTCNVHTYAHMHTYTCTYTHIYAHVYRCAYLHTHTHTNTCIDTCMHAHIHAHTYTCTYTHTDSLLNLSVTASPPPPPPPPPIRRGCQRSWN